MKLTIEQALKKAVENHKTGKSQDAEALYRAILQAQPKHPDANHNLGVLAVSVNKLEAALPLFKTALEANPSHGQFWLSYIDALIKEKQFDNARNLLEQGKKSGLAGEKVDALEAHLATSLLAQNPESPLPTKENPTLTQQRKKVSSSNQKNLNQARSPSQEEDNALLENYQKGQYDLAENLAKDLIQKYSDHQFSWKVLGAVFKQTGRLQKSLVANQRAVEISPNDAEAHSNLGITLQELGRLEDAEASHKQAIAIKPDYAEAHTNLGNTLKELGRLEDAEASHKQAIAIKPDFAEAYYNLGITLKELGRLEDAETSYKKAIAIKPDYAEAHCNLGNIYLNKKQPIDAYKHIRIALYHSPKLAPALLIESSALSQLVPHWHVPMVNEKKRNDAYYFALEAVINPNSSVFEIGTGSGLLSMMAAKMKAKKITTCESNPIIAEKANTIITNSGYKKVINLISKKSTDIILDVDLSEKSNILVSEIFSSELLGEGVLPAIEDVKRRLLTLDAKIIPATASIMVSMFGGQEVQDYLYVKNYHGLKIEEFNSIIPKKALLNSNQLPINLFTDEVEAFRFEFESNSYFPIENKILNLPIKSSGICCGIVQWIRLEMTKDIFYENHPSDGSTRSHWQHVAYIFKEPIKIREGQTAVVSAQHNRINSWFSLQEIKG
jgi:protein arginine N-methyltransferase 7